MKKSLLIVTGILFLLPTLSWGGAPPGCNTIKSGQLVDSAGNPVTLGYDQYGYNYQAHMFNGLYANFGRPAVPYTEGLDNLMMKWSDEWMSNLDCNGDGKLDRGLDRATGESDGISKGWLTNHMEGDYEGADGEYHHYTYYCKIVWVGPPPEDKPDPWAEVRIWGQYAVIEEVENDPYAGLNGNKREIMTNPAGLGYHTN